MPNTEISEIKRIFLTRLDMLDHLLDVGAQHLDLEVALQERLAEDMFPLGTQVVFSCNQPRGFAQWCADQPIQNLPIQVDNVAQARAHIADTKAMVQAINVDDRKLDEDKRVGMGPGRHAMLPARQYVNDYLMPNLYFHISMAYAVLRSRGAPVGKSNYLPFLAPYVRTEASN